ncbi:MAG: molybdopterin oxidoreductase family protein [Deltaproteobacteria bacterium]
MARTHHRTCHLCEAMCGVTISIDDDENITRITGDEDDPFSLGHICPKAAALKDVHEDPDRLKTPMRREGDRWLPMDWDEAFDRVATELRSIQKKYGRSAVGLYQGNPSVHNLGSMTHGQVFARALRTPNKFSATSLDQLPHMLAGLMMFGHQLMLPVPDVDRTDYFLVLGANPLISNGSLMTAPGIKKRLEALRARGGRLVVVDPRRTETAEMADTHVPIQPGGDAYFLLGLLHVVLRDRGAQLGRLSRHAVGLAEVERLAQAYPPSRVAERCGVPAEQIESIALAFADAPTAVAYGRVGVCTQEFGGLNAWLINVLCAVTGNLDRAGGAMFTSPAVDPMSAEQFVGLRGHFGRRRSRVRGLPEFGGEFPSSALAEEIDTPGEGQIRALVTSCGNPVLSAPNGRRLDEALASLELMVSVDIYLNETTRHAHYVLPPTFGLERDHYDLIFHLLAVRNTAKFSGPTFERAANQRHDWEIWQELAWRLEKPSLVRTAKKAVLNRLTPRHVIDLGLRTGAYELSVKKLLELPHGVDLGPLKPVLPDRLFTRDHRVDLAPALFLDDVDRLEKRLVADSSGGMSLIGRRELRTNNSWMHNSERLVKGRERCTLRIHPSDAERLSLADGDAARIASAVGEISAPVEVTDEMRPGVVSLPHGWGHNRDGVRLRVASSRPGVSINDLTDDGLLDELSGTVRFSDVPVTITRVEG